MLVYYKDIKKAFILLIIVLTGFTSISQNFYKVQYNLTLESPFTGTEITVVEYRIQFRSGINFYNYYSEFAFTNETITTERDLVVDLSFNPDTILITAVALAAGNVPCDTPSQNTIPYDSTTDCVFLPVSDIDCIIPSSNGNPLIMSRISGLESLNTTNGNNQLTSCEPRTVSTISCTNIAMSYKVEYQIGANTSTWTILLPYARRNSDFDIQASDFPGISAGSIRLRVSYEDSANPFRQILSLNYVECSPAFTSINTEGARCVYSNDGDFTINFSETLVNVPLQFNLFSFPDGVLINTPIFTVSGNDISWSTIVNSMEGVLDPGMYRLTYQRLPDSQPIPSIGEPLIIITIGSPPPLKYDVELFSDIECFNANDGEITITINPSNNGSIGTPPYRYEINGTSVDFIGSFVTIAGLGIGQRVLKVFDSNNCTQRQ